jgi:hypothetical protein
MEKANRSDLPTKIKNKIADLKLDYVYNSKRESETFLGMLTFGSSARHIREKKLKCKVEDLKLQISGLPMFIKMNY